MRIILPATDEGALADILRQITKAIDERRGEAGGYGLGGSHGYGAHWDSDVFMMHPYCWCERDECPWCAYDEDDSKRPTPQALANGGVKDFTEEAAPNFWHKPSGLRVWWYKYIGRSMVVYGEGDLMAIGQACLADIADAALAPRND